MNYVQNKKATFDYEIRDRYEAGLVLSGSEVKAIRAGKANLQGSYVVVRGGEAYLVNATISPYQEKNTPENYESDQPRKLLLSKKELEELGSIERQKGLTIIPIRLYNSGRKIKLEVGVGRGKKQHDKREVLKERTAKRDIERSLKYR